MDCSPPGSTHGLLQARILEWVASSSSWGSSQPRDRTLTLPAFTVEFFATSATWEALTPLGPYFWTLCTLKWASANWPSAVSGACITLSLHLWVQHAAPLQGCLCVVLYPSFDTVKPWPTLMLFLGANQVDFPQSQSSCRKLELTALRARLHKIFFKFYEQLPHGVSWKMIRWGGVVVIPYSCTLRKCTFAFIFRIYIKTITFDVSLQNCTICYSVIWNCSFLR